MESPATMPEELPYLLGDGPDLEARIKCRPGDFRVDEIPAYDACGSGDHVLFRIRKRGMPTPRALTDLARALDVRTWEIGCAGLKDAFAVTTQWLSVEHRSVERVLELDLPGIHVLEARPHRNKLRKGHLRGNRFTIRLRGLDAAAAESVGGRLEELARRGAPNYFGPQRFGHRGDAGRIGEALLREDWATAVDLVAGSPTELDTGDVLEARRLFAEGAYADSAARWPRGFEDCAAVARKMGTTDGDAARAARALPRRARNFFVSAWQSMYFNAILAERLRRADVGIERPLEGDLAYLHANGAVFRVDDPAAEEPRARAFEISPSGPLVGERVLLGEGLAGEIERDVLATTLADGPLLSRATDHGGRGGRRALRIAPRDLSSEGGEDEHGSFVEVSFSLDPGCYATTLLREVVREVSGEPGGAAPAGADARDRGGSV